MITNKEPCNIVSRTQIVIRNGITIKEDHKKVISNELLMCGRNQWRYRIVGKND